MVQSGAGEQLEAGTKSAALGVVRSVNEPRNARLDDGAGAHDARFERNVENGAGEAVVVQQARSLAKDDDLGVSGGVVVTNGAIARTREDRIVVNEHGTDGDFTSGCSGAGLIESKLQIVKIVRHGGNKQKNSNIQRL